MMGFRARERIQDEAARWVMRLDRELPTPALLAELNTWLSSDARHQGAFLRAEAMWASLDLLSGETDAGDRPEEPRDRATSGKGWIASILGVGVAASLAGAFLLGGQPTTYETSFGEIRRVPLADGSAATINSESLVSVDFEAKRRAVELVRGEAWFHVAKNPAKPFVVSAGRVRAQAVGTAFSVRRYANGADILVTQGTVQVWANGAEGHRVMVRAGNRAFVANDAGILFQSADKAEVERELAWRSGKIDLIGNRLADAIKEFNRYNVRKITLGDAAFANERFYGVFRIDDPEGFAVSVRDVLGVPVDMSESEIIIGGPKKDSAVKKEAARPIV